MDQTENIRTIFFKPARKSLIIIPAVLSLFFLTGCSADDPSEPETLIRIAANEEFIVHEEGLTLLEEKYGLVFDQVHEMSLGLTHEALCSGDVDAAIGFSTDGKMKELELVKLLDDKNIFPACNTAPVVREDTLKRYPHIEEILSEISPLIDNRTMVELNYRADLEGVEPPAVARYWLLDKGLIEDNSEGNSNDITGNEEPVVIGSKEFVEQELLGYIAYYALKNAGIPVQVHDPVAGTEAIRLRLLIGEIDLYWDYTGVVWSEIYLKDEKITDPGYVYRRVAEKDAKKGLIWLDYAPLNKTYIIMMRRDQAHEYGISTISDFSTWVEQVRSGE